MYKSLNNSYLNAIWSILIAACSMVLLTACDDDESFTSDSSAVLVFETDTVSFDTVFSTVPSSTRRILLFNHAKKGLRIQSVSLSSGGRSGFRINIDGYSGPTINQLEVEGEDSLFLFSDVTLPMQTSDTPTLVSDTVIFELESGVRQSLILQATAQNADILTTKTLTRDMTIDNTRPCIVRDSLIVAEGVTLTLKEGAMLCFHSGAWLGVKGKLHVEGSAESPVVFRGDRTDRMFSYLPYDRLDGQWGGIVLQAGCEECKIDHADIHGGAWGIIAEDFGIESEILTLTNSVIHNVRGCALQLSNLRATVTNSLLSNAGENCVRLDGGAYTFIYSTLAQFYPWSSCGYALSMSAGSDDDYKPLSTANFFNCLITGRTADQISLSPPKNVDIPFIASFTGSLVNIDLPDNTPERYKEMFEGVVNEYSQFENPSTVNNSDDSHCGKRNFKSVNDELYDYDFHLDSLSNARGIANIQVGGNIGFDMEGTPRSTNRPDAGCYQFK